MTFGQIADELEEKGILKVYDWATPQPWFDTMLANTGQNPSGHIVWSYDKSWFGRPFAITMFGWQLLKIAGEV